MYRVARRFRPPICTESINRSRRSYYRAMIIRRPMVSGRTACAETANDVPIPGSGRPPKELTCEPPEAVLVEGESISEFVEASVRAGVELRRVQSEFVSRGLRSRDEARRTGDYVDADIVVDGPVAKKKPAATKASVKKVSKARHLSPTAGCSPTRLGQRVASAATHLMGGVH